MPEVELVARLRAAGCVFAEQEAAILTASAASPAALAAMTGRRVAGEPLEHVVGWAEFGGRRVAVRPGVFVPRRRSEFLVARAVAGTPRGAVVVDLCCGSGALGAVITDAVGAAELHAADADPVAVACARENLPGALPRAEVHLGDLDAALPEHLRGRVDLLVAVTPYVPSDAVRLMPPEARDHEPHRALDGGPDGLDVVRRLAAAAPSWLAPGGRLLVEVSARQAPDAAAAVTAAGLEAWVERDEEADATVVGGWRGEREVTVGARRALGSPP